MSSLPLDEICRSTTELLRSTPAPLRRLRVSSGDASVELEWPVAGDSPVPIAAAGDTTSGDDGGGVDDRPCVRSPMVGTFYLAPEPGGIPFVQVGDVVEARQQVGIVEAMKLMNPVEAGTSGRVVELLVEDAARVEYEQPLMLLAPVVAE